ncbi:hypothetical protein JW921_00090 [Candidatus Fermentibacterales bacterium]|nr:hypothetical protein [Candidatus Fermentibacterales bacterium]
MRELALELVARAVSVGGVRCDEKLDLYCGPDLIGSIVSTGNAAMVEIHAHPDDARVLIEECPGCSPSGDSARAALGWVSFVFASGADPYLLSFFVESVRSALDRLEAAREAGRPDP